MIRNFENYHTKVLNKSLIVIVIIIALMVLLIPAFGCAEIIASGKVGELDWTYSDDKTLTISGNGVIPERYADHMPWYDEERGCNYTIEKIVIDEGITRIGDSCFRAIGSDLKSVSLPKSLKTIGGCNFDNCHSLEEIVFPEGLKEIGGGSLQWCQSLKKVSIPSSLVKIGCRRRGPGSCRSSGRRRPSGSGR